jgi:hypothetical protein
MRLWQIDLDHLVENANEALIGAKKKMMIRDQMAHLRFLCAIMDAALSITSFPVLSRTLCTTALTDHTTPQSGMHEPVNSFTLTARIILQKSVSDKRA